jgi:hypothetical protein
MEVIELELLAGQVDKPIRESILTQLSASSTSGAISFMDFLVSGKSIWCSV